MEGGFFHFAVFQMAHLVVVQFYLVIEHTLLVLRQLTALHDVNYLMGVRQTGHL